MTELLVAMRLIAGVVAAHKIGFWVGSLTRSKDEPFDRQVGLVFATGGMGFGGASPCFAAVYQAIKTHGHPDVSAPSGPDFHQFAKLDMAVKLLSASGFSNIDVTTVDCEWNLAAPDDLFEIYAKGTVRAAMVLSKQPPGNLAAIRSALTGAVREQFARGDRCRVPVPAALVRATA